MDVMFIQAFPLRGGGLAWKTQMWFLTLRSMFDLGRTWWRKSCRSSRSNQSRLATTERVQNGVLTQTMDLKIHVLSFWKSHHLKWRFSFWCQFFTTFPYLPSVLWAWWRYHDSTRESSPTAGPQRRNDDLGSKEARVCRMGKRPTQHTYQHLRSLNERFFIFKNHGDVWLAPFWDFLASAMGTTGKNPITNYIHLFIVFTAEIQLLKVTDRIFEAPKIACKTNSCSFWCLPWNIFCKCFRSIHKNIFKWKEIYTREEANIKDVSLQTSTHQNWNCKSIAIPCCPSNVAWELPRPRAKRGEGTLMASWLCAATTYGSTAGASARKRWKGVLDHDYWRIPAWWILSFLVKVRQKKRLRWEKGHHASFFEDLGPCFWWFWFVRGGHIQMLTADSCKRNSSRSLWLIYLQKILVSLNP